MPWPRNVLPPKEGVRQPQQKKRFVDIQAETRIPAGHFRCSLRCRIEGGSMAPMVDKVKRYYHV